MSKKYINKPCVYCGKVAATADHIFAREFFLPTDRTGLPKVPSCTGCNRQKSTLEHYLTTVLPFGGRHPDALAHLSQKVPARLAKNQRLHSELASQRSKTWDMSKSGIALPALAIPLDGNKLTELVGLIVKGLVWHHWQVMLGAGSLIDVQCLTAAGEAHYRRFLNLNANQRISNVIGNHVFAYEGAQGVDDPTVSIWLLSILGGAKFTDGAGEHAALYGAMTGPQRSFQNAERRYRWLSGQGAFTKSEVR